MLRSRRLVLLSIAAVIIGVALGALLLPKPAAKGTIALLAAQHGGISGQVTQVILHGHDGDVTINPQAQPLARELHDKHFLRKHGANAYYGQPGEK